MLLRRWSGGVVVFVDESIEDSLPPDPVDRDRVGGLVVDVGGGVLVDSSVGAVGVGVVEVLDERRTSSKSV